MIGLDILPEEKHITKEVAALEIDMEYKWLSAIFWPLKFTKVW